MRTKHLKKTGILSFLILMPTLALAEGGLEGLEVLDTIVDTYQSLLVTGIVGAIFAFIYLLKNSKWAFYLSMLTASTLFTFYAYSFFVFPPELYLGTAFIKPLQNHVFLLFSITLVTISAGKFREDPTRLFWYFTLNTFSILLMMLLLSFLTINFPLGIIFQAFLYAWFSFLYTRKKIYKGQTKTKQLMLNVGLVATLCYLTVYAFAMFELLFATFRDLALEQMIQMTLKLVPVGLVVAIGITCLSAFAAIKKYR